MKKKEIKEKAKNLSVEVLIVFIYVNDQYGWSTNYKNQGS